MRHLLLVVVMIVIGPALAGADAGRKVYLDALIVEVQLPDDLGGSFHGFIGGRLPSAEDLLDLGQSVPSHDIVLRWDAKRLNATIWSMSTVVLDDEHATYEIHRTIDRKDLSFELDVQSHISSNGLVVLAVHSGNALARCPDPPCWSESRAYVRDGQTVELDPDVFERLLLASTTKGRTQPALLVWLTPYLVRDQQDVEHIRARRAREEREFVRSLEVLHGIKCDPRIDYARKRGLIEEINRSIARVTISSSYSRVRTFSSYR